MRYAALVAGREYRRLIQARVHPLPHSCPRAEDVQHSLQAIRYREEAGVCIYQYQVAWRAPQGHDVPAPNTAGGKVGLVLEIAAAEIVGLEPLVGEQPLEQHVGQYSASMELCELGIESRVPQGQRVPTGQTIRIGGRHTLIEEDIAVDRAACGKFLQTQDECRVSRDAGIVEMVLICLDGDVARVPIEFRHLPRIPILPKRVVARAL